MAKQRAVEVDFSDNIFRRLMTVIEERKVNPPARSYTTSLFQGGIDRIGAKLTEEAVEAVEAGRESGDAGRQHLVHEAADVLYHLFVLLGFRDVPLAAVEQELAQRFGISGLDEKASRAANE